VKELYTEWAERAINSAKFWWNGVTFVSIGMQWWLAFQRWPGLLVYISTAQHVLLVRSPHMLVWSAEKWLGLCNGTPWTWDSAWDLTLYSWVGHPRMSWDIRWVFSTRDNTLTPEYPTGHLEPGTLGPFTAYTAERSRDVLKYPPFSWPPILSIPKYPTLVSLSAVHLRLRGLWCMLWIIIPPTKP